MGPRRSFPRPRKVTAVRWVAALVVIATGLWQAFFSDRHDPSRPIQPGETAFVERAVDGDTLLLEGHVYVRLLGVDTPETKRPNWPVEPFGAEAHEYTRSRVEKRQVRLEFDKERRDKYDRVLAYVYVDDSFLNEDLIRTGMGRAITNHPYSEAMKRRFRAAENAARRERLGIWSLAK